jgi:hypothetical protein
VVDLVGLEMGLSVYSGTSRLPLPTIFMINCIYKTWLGSLAKVENPVPPFEVLKIYFCTSNALKVELESSLVSQGFSFCIVKKLFYSTVMLG